MKFIILLSAIFAVSYATVSGDYGSVGIQGEQTVRGALNTISSYQKAVNTGNSQSFVSRTDYTNNPGIIAHPLAAIASPVVAHAPYGGYAAPVVAHAPYGGYAAPLGAYHAPLAGAYHAAAPAYYH